MASGAPVVASDLGQLATQVDESGVTVSSDNIEGLPPEL